MTTCLLCEKNSDNQTILVKYPKGSICQGCLHIGITEIDSVQAQLNSVGPISKKEHLKPKEISERLDEYIIGQERAKKVLSTAVFNHLYRIESKKNLDKSNIIIFGPTGCGKTFVLKNLAKILDIPVSITDSTSLTQAGYVGKDVESILLSLLKEANFNKNKAQKGIIYIDEIDKIKESSSERDSKDVAGKAVQASLLKLVEGSILDVPLDERGYSSRSVLFDTKSVLFVVGGAFVGLEDIVAKRLRKDFSKTDRNTLLKEAIPQDFVDFGFLPEFVGRFVCLSHLNQLSSDDFVRILKEPKNSITSQYQELFKSYGTKLIFKDDAFKEIALKAQRFNTGARGLKTVFEELLLDLMYEAPSDPNMESITITGNYVKQAGAPIIKRKK